MLSVVVSAALMVGCGAQFAVMPQMSLGDCYPPMPGGGSACTWTCGSGFIAPRCQGVHYCGPNSTACTVNCYSETGCSENLFLISQSRKDTRVNCMSASSACKKIAVHCGDFNAQTVANIQRAGMFRLMEVFNAMLGVQHNFMLRAGALPLQRFFTKQPGRYGKCVLSCAGEGDTCSEALMSCAGQFDTGCQVVAPSVSPNAGEAFKNGQFLCDLRNTGGHSGACLLKCADIQNTAEFHCRDARYGCVQGIDPARRGPSTPGKCFCDGPICQSVEKMFLGPVIEAIPPPPTPEPTKMPTRTPTTRPTEYPTYAPTTPRPTRRGETRRPTPKPTRVKKVVTRRGLPVGANEFPRVVKLFGRVKKWSVKLDIASMSDRRGLGGNQLECTDLKCELRCASKDVCARLVVRLGADVETFKLTCEVASACREIEVFSDARETKVECKADKACVGARINVDAPFERSVGTPAGKQIAEVQCDASSCHGNAWTPTIVNCGFNVAECKVQAGSSGKTLPGFSGLMNCYTDNLSNKCNLECAGTAMEPTCTGATFLCKDIAHCDCVEGPSGYKDCPEIGSL